MRLSPTALWKLGRVMGLVALCLHAGGRTISACAECEGEWTGTWCCFPDGSLIRIGLGGQIEEE